MPPGDPGRSESIQHGLVESYRCRATKMKDSRILSKDIKIVYREQKDIDAG